MIDERQVALLSLYSLKYIVQSYKIILKPFMVIFFKYFKNYFQITNGSELIGPYNSPCEINPQLSFM